MNVQNVIKEFESKYPGKVVIKNDELNPTEILCEIEPTKDHPEYSNAVAVIDKSKPHVHHKTTETYKVIKGKLTLHVDDEKKELSQGDSFTIEPGYSHWAEGNETWIECFSKPGWTLEDHILQ